MKKLLLIGASLLVAAGVFAQGTVTFNNRVVGTIVTHVYLGPNGVFQTGNDATTDTPAGTQTYGAGYTLLAGANYLAQLLAATGNNQPVASLVEATSAPTTFRTGAAAGFVNATTATFGNVAKDAAAATLQLVVWDNTSGLYPTWAAAKLAPLSVARGSSPAFNLAAIGGDVNTPPNLAGLVSFNIAAVVPEPSTLALAGLGLASLVIFRRRK